MHQVDEPWWQSCRAVFVASLHQQPNPIWFAVSVEPLPCIRMGHRVYHQRWPRRLSNIGASRQHRFRRPIQKRMDMYYENWYLYHMIHFPWIYFYKYIKILVNMFCVHFFCGNIYTYSYKPPYRQTDRRRTDTHIPYQKSLPANLQRCLYNKTCNRTITYTRMCTKRWKNGQLPVPKNYFETISEIEIFVSRGKQIIIQNLEYLFCERNKYSRFIT